jgi:ATP-dependent helicase/nuclease subunit A
MTTELTSVWISANAGSGKTRALVNRVVRLLLLGVAPERICCITYTKAAANEMRARIVKNLRELLIADDVACAKKLSEFLEREPNTADIARARQLFSSVLDSPYGGVQLTTIHGFCQQLLRKFPIEAGIPPLFSILDDAGRENLQRMARHRLFDMNDETMLTQSIRLLAERSGEAQVEALLDAVEQRHGEWSLVLNHQSSEHLAALIYAEHRVSPEMTEDVINAEFSRTLLNADEVKVLRAALPEFFAHKNKTEQKLGSILARWLEFCDDDTATEALLSHFVTKKYTANAKSISKNAPLPELLSRIRERCVAHRLQRAALVCAEESAALARVAFSYRALLQQLKFERQSLDYDDLIQHTTELLCGPMIGWVMRKLDHRIDHLLIDEAQDTSPEQWKIARALVEELIATTDGVSEGEIPRSLLVVGDEKQSIFSFQGAAPEYFAREEIYFKQRLRASAAPLHRSCLQTSYRSAHAVLTLVDTVAALPSVAAALSESGIHVPHVLHRKAAGIVRLYPLVIADAKPSAEPFRIPTEYLESQSSATLLANQIAAHIAGWLSENRWLPSEHRPIRPGDILILVHRRRPMAPALIRALEKHGVPVSGMDRLTLSTHLAVRDILALMAWCMHQGDDLALAQVLRSPVIGMSDEALRSIAVNRDGRLWDALKNSSHPQGREYLDEMLSLRDLPPYEFLTQLLEVMGARRRFAERFGAEVHQILDELKSQAAQMPADMLPSIAYFYDWMMKSERVIKREHESGNHTVQIMTVHGAKGLEAPIVLLADTTSVPDLKKEAMYFFDSAHGQRLPMLALSDEAKFAPMFEQAKMQRKAALEEEYQRLLYVALTRARDELHVYGFASKEPKSADASESDNVTSWYCTVDAAFAQLPNVTESVDGALEFRDAMVDTIIPTPRQDEVAHPLPSFLTQPTPCSTARLTPLSPSSIGASALHHESGKADAATRGVRMHRVLQWLRADSDASMIAALIRLVAADWDEVAQRQACDEISAVLAMHPWIWCSPSQAEVGISGTLEINGKIQSFMGQIDRIVETSEALVIIDFKTGQPTERIADHYLLQFKVYHGLVQKIYPNKPIRSALLWTATAQLCWLDTEVMQVAWPPSLSLQELMENSAAELDAPLA